MPITFPNSPAAGDIRVDGGRRFQYDGSAWNSIVASATTIGSITYDQIAGGVSRSGDVLARTADGLEWRTLPNEAVIKSLHSGMAVSNTATAITVASGYCGENDGSEIMIRPVQTLAWADAALDAGVREADTLYWLWQMWSVGGGTGVLRLSKSRTAPAPPANHRPGRILGAVWSNTATALHPSTMTGDGLDRAIATSTSRNDVADRTVRFTGQTQEVASASVDMSKSVPAYPFGGFPRCTLSVSVTASADTLPEKWFVGGVERTATAGTSSATLADVEIPATGALRYGIRNAGADRQGRRAAFTIRVASRDFSLAVEDSR